MGRTLTVVLALMFGVGALGVGSAAHAGATLDNIRAKGFITCGVSTGVAGFSLADSQGKYTGLDVDICRAFSAAIFGTPDKTKFIPLSAAQRLTALQSGEIDVLTRNTTWTLSREAAQGLLFGPVVFYDGQAFMVSKKLGLKSAEQLSGATVCVQTGTTTEQNTADYARAHSIQMKPVAMESLDQVESAFYSGRCDAFTADSSALAASRQTKAAKPDDYVILPQRISKEPLAPVVRQGDDQFFDIVRWTVYVLFEAEERGISSTTVDQALKSDDPNTKRLLGVTPGNGKALGLDERWAYNVIKTVGNYAEVFDRNLGVKSPLKLDRGLNDLWTGTGLMYAPPFR